MNAKVANGKFASSGQGRVGNYGGLEDYSEGLEARVGLPADKACLSLA